MSNLSIPTLDQLVANDDNSFKQDALTVLLNNAPPQSWLKQHPTAKYKNETGQNVPAPYLPIDKVEYLLTKIFGTWWVEIREIKPVANSVVVTVRLWVIDPITKQPRFNDGVGATPIQTESGAGAMDWNAVKSNGVQIAAPAAETYAIKDAAEKFGRLFGKDLTRINTMNYETIMKKYESVTVEVLRDLLDEKRDKVSVEFLKEANAIINNKREKDFARLYNDLKAA